VLTLPGRRQLVLLSCGRVEWTAAWHQERPSRRAGRYGF